MSFLLHILEHYGNIWIKGGDFMTVKGMMPNEPGLSNMPVELINNGSQIFFGDRSQLSDSLLDMEFEQLVVKADRLIFHVKA